jgi:hypothetical protein
MTDGQTVSGAGAVNMVEYRFPSISEYLKFVVDIPVDAHVELRPDLLLVRVFQ